MIEPLNIIIDSREQRPWSWAKNDAATSVRSLVAGDYALASDCEEVKGKQMLAVRFAIERKSLDDFLGTISTGWDRFQRELIRMESFPARVVIVEGDFSACCFAQGEGCVIPPPHNHPALIVPRKSSSDFRSIANRTANASRPFTRSQSSARA